MLHVSKFWLLAAAMLLLATPAVQAADENAKKAATSVAEADADYPFVGEYDGEITIGRQGTFKIGVQVVALGNGKFQATEFPGGLPGAGWNGHGRVMMLGERQGSTVHLEGYPLELKVDANGFASVQFAGGREVGELQKVDRSSSSIGLEAPEDYKTTILYDGHGTEHLKGAKVHSDGNLLAGFETVNGYNNFTLHVEFMTPYMPEARGQGRGNSGVYLQSRYEVQVLDSFGLEGADNECGALYKLKAPDTNMALPPLVWQSYDIEFTAAEFDADGKKTANARLTVLHNGKKIHDNVEITRKTGGGAAEGSEALPIKFQDHGNPVLYRNVWIVDHDAKPPCRTVCFCCKRRLCCFTCCESAPPAPTLAPAMAAAAKDLCSPACVGNHGSSCSNDSGPVYGGGYYISPGNISY